jgi:hypothetical protein
MPHRQPPVSRTFASGTRNENCLDRPRLPWCGYRAVGARSGVAGHRSPRKPAATRDRGPTRRADVLPYPVASAYPRLPIPLLEPRAGKRARTRAHGLGRGHQAGGVTPVERDAGPAGKTSNPRLPPRDAERAVGGIQAWVENPGRRASSPTTLLRFATIARRPQKVCPGFSRGTSADSPPSGRPESAEAVQASQRSRRVCGRSAGAQGQSVAATAHTHHGGAQRAARRLAAWRHPRTKPPGG